MASARISILSVDESTVTPLNFRGWLRNEAIDIQRTAKGEGDVIVVRLYMTEKYRYAVKPAALDKMLKAVVDRHPNIYRVELELVDQAFTAADMAGASREAQEELNAFAQSIKKNPGEPTKH